MIRQLLLLVFLFLIIQADIKSDIQKLNKDLSKDFWTKDQKYRPLITWKHTQGLYSSEIHFNIVDKKNKLTTALQRQKLKITDENMFVTSFVLYGLL